MIYECFLDDSKDAKQEYAYVCAGFHASRLTWARFRLRWDAALKAEGIRYFKTSEYKSLSGQFAHFKLLEHPYGRQGADLVKGRLMKVVMDCKGLTGIGVAIPVSVHDEVMAHPSAPLVFVPPDPYYRVFEAVLLKAANSISNGWIEFVHDDGPDFDILRRYYNAFADVNKETCKKMGGLIPLDDKQHGPLQIADMLANSVMGRFTDQIKGYAVDPQTEVDFFEMSHLFTWSKPYFLEVMRHELERRGLPVPDDLLALPRGGD